MTIRSLSQKALRGADQLALYDQYGSIAYGIILHIISEEELAQAVLVDLFTSLHFTSHTKSFTTGEIIRLARAKALAARPVPSGTALTSGSASGNTTETAKLVFNLSFCQGYTFEAIAEKLQLSPTNVLKALYLYFRQFPSSQSQQP